MTSSEWDAETAPSVASRVVMSLEAIDSERFVLHPTIRCVIPSRVVQRGGISTGDMRVR